MRKRLERVPKIGGVPLTRATANGLSRAAKDIVTGQKATLEEREEIVDLLIMPRTTTK
jgi:hypothetical protein